MLNNAYFVYWGQSNQEIGISQASCAAKVVDNHVIKKCGKFWAFILNHLEKNNFQRYWLLANREMVSKWVKMNFHKVGVNTKVVDDVKDYQCMKLQTKLLTRCPEEKILLLRSGHSVLWGQVPPPKVNPEIFIHPP